MLIAKRSGFSSSVACSEIVVVNGVAIIKGCVENEHVVICIYMCMYIYILACNTCIHACIHVCIPKLKCSNLELS